MIKNIGIGIFLMAIIGLNAKSQENDNQNKVTPKQQKQFTYALGIKYNDYSIAKSSLYDLIAMDPQNDSLLFNLAYLYFDSDQYASSILVCRDVLLRNPDNIGALEISAISYENLGLKDRALEHYEKIHLKRGDNMNTLFKMITLQYELKRFNECKTNLDILLQNNQIDSIKLVFNIKEDQQKEFPMRIPALNIKGLVYKELGDIETAKSSFQKALDLDPDFELARQGLDSINK